MTTPDTAAAEEALWSSPSATPSREQRQPDNADPHPVTITVYPRERVISYAHEHEAEYDFEVECPPTCSAHVEECPVQDYLDTIGIEQGDFVGPADIVALDPAVKGFPEPDLLSDEDLAALDGTVRYVVITRTYHHSSGPYGDDWDVEYGFVWSDSDLPSAAHLSPEPRDGSIDPAYMER